MNSLDGFLGDFDVAVLVGRDMDLDVADLVGSAKVAVLLGDVLDQGTMDGQLKVRTWRETLYIHNSLDVKLLDEGVILRGRVSAAEDETRLDGAVIGRRDELREPSRSRQDSDRRTSVHIPSRGDHVAGCSNDCGRELAVKGGHVTCLLVKMTYEATLQPKLWQCLDHRH